MNNAIGATAALMFCMWMFGIGMSIYGLYLAFSASVILGIVALFVEPSPLIFGIVMFLFDKNLPHAIMDYLNK